MAIALEAAHQLRRLALVGRRQNLDHRQIGDLGNIDLAGALGRLCCLALAPCLGGGCFFATFLLEFGGDLKRDNEGDLVLVEGRVLDDGGAPIANAELDIWQTASNGMYSSQDAEQATYKSHALMTTDDEGRYAFTTVKPVDLAVHR